MRTPDGKRAWRELEGPWGECQVKLRDEVDGLIGLLEAGTTNTHRQALALASALAAAREADGYVWIGEPALAANALLVAVAWSDLAIMPDETYNAAVVATREGRRRAPMVEALTAAAAHVRGMHPQLENMSVPACTTRGTTPAPRSAGAPSSAAPVGEVVGLVRPARRARGGT